MRKHTKILSALLTLVMILGLLPVTALAADTVEIKWLPKGMNVVTYIEGTEQFLAKNGTVWFLLDKAGNIAAPVGDLEYEPAGIFSEGLAAVKKDGKYGYMNQDLELVIPAGFDNARPFFEGLAAVEVSGKYGFIDMTGKMVIQPAYDYANDFSEGLAAVRVGDYETGKWGFIDKTGKEVVRPAYNTAGNFSEGLAAVAVGTGESAKCGFIDKTGKIVIPIEYDSVSTMDTMIGPFSEGLAAVRKDGTYCYIDTAGKVAFTLDIAYGYCGPFSGGLAGIESGLKTRYLDKTGKTVFQVDGYWGAMEISGFTDGLAEIEKSEEEWRYRAYINQKGENIFGQGQFYSAIGLWGPVGVVLGEDEREGVFQNPYYTSAQPEQPTQPVTPATAEAMPTNDKLTVNGVLQNPTVYKINDSNYFKIRDLAAVLNGTSRQFAVGYDAASSSITATSGQSYTKLDTDLVGAPSGKQTATASNDTIIVNGRAASVEVYKIDGSNYFKLRDLGDALGFDVGWSAEQGIFIDTNG